jgi:hypothetical protein
MRRTLIAIVVLVAIFDSAWIVNRLSPEEPEYRVCLSCSESFFKDGGLHLEDESKLPVWDGKRWTLNGQTLSSISSEVGKRPLENDNRCVFEYRLQEDVTFGDFLSAQKQAEDAGSSIMIMTSKFDENWARRAKDFDWVLFNSTRKNIVCRAAGSKTSTT